MCVYTFDPLEHCITLRCIAFHYIHTYTHIYIYIHTCTYTSVSMYTFKIGLAPTKTPIHMNTDSYVARRARFVAGVKLSAGTLKPKSETTLAQDRFLSYTLVCWGPEDPQSPSATVLGGLGFFALRVRNS